MVDFKKYREACGLKQAEAARQLGLKSRGVLQNYEAGIRTPSFETILKMAELYDVPSYILLGLDENAPDADIRAAMVQEVLNMDAKQMKMLLCMLDAKNKGLSIPGIEEPEERLEMTPEGNLVFVPRDREE